MAGLLPYCVIGVLAIVFRVNDLEDSGRCLIGVERQTSILVIVYDLLINVSRSWHCWYKVYLTIQFLLPILGLYSFQHEPSTPLRKVAIRTFSMIPPWHINYSWNSRNAHVKCCQYNGDICSERFGTSFCIHSLNSIDFRSVYLVARPMWLLPQ